MMKKWYIINKETSLITKFGEDKDYSNGDIIYETNSFEEAKKVFDSMNGKGEINHLNERKKGVLYELYDLYCYETDENGEVCGNIEELDRKLITINSKNKIFDNYGISKLENPFIGYFYIDREDGICIRIIGNEDNKELPELLF